MAKRTRSRETTGDPAPVGTPTGWRAYRREITFLVLFLVLLGGGFSFIAWTPVNDGFVEPFTAGIARVSAVTLDLLGQDVTRSGTIITSDRFAVNIRNGCNGLETVLIFLAAVLAFPAPWRSRAVGVVLGVAAIQVVNLVRVVALFLTGAYMPDLFDASHTVIWQTVVILCGVLLWIVWADRFARPALQRDAAAS
ncbi:MAG TPA: exosortase H [Thermoanaerobaculia bacterium]|nr:exosortase H [Thermoanaerobaculia bacterium]